MHELFFQNMGPAIPTSPSVELMEQNKWASNFKRLIKKNNIYFLPYLSADSVDASSSDSGKFFENLV